MEARPGSRSSEEDGAPLAAVSAAARRAGPARLGPRATGRLVESTQAEDRRLIALVGARPLLYARSTLPVASYYSQVKKLWQQVADLMGWTGTNNNTTHSPHCTHTYLSIRYLLLFIQDSILTHQKSLGVIFPTIKIHTYLIIINDLLCFQYFLDHWASV